MLRMLCHCVVLIVVFACGGVLMMSHKQHNRHTGDILSKPTLPSGFTFEDYNEVHHSGDDHIIRDLPFRKVSREEFEKHMLTAKSSADLLKIFFDDPNLTDEQVDFILRMKAHSRLHSTDWSRETEGTYVNDGRNLNDEHKQLAYKNLEETWKNPYHICNDPRPEIVRVESVESGVIRTFYPDCTVVHRCRNTSGCCPKGSECGPKTVGSFTKYFHVFENSMDGSFLRPVIQVTEPRTFLNHTSCECKKIETKSNCVKKCPSQFNQERTGINCECKCNRHNKKCLRIQKGFIPLDEHDLMCIKSDECLIPTCIVGEFRVRSGFCPHVGRHHHRISD